MTFSVLPKNPEPLTRLVFLESKMRYLRDHETFTSIPFEYAEEENEMYDERRVLK